MVKSNWDGLKKLQKKMKMIEGTNEVRMGELFPRSFMIRYTQYDSLEEFFSEGGFEIESEKEFEQISEEKLNTHVKSTTSFNSWDEMKAKAGAGWVKNNIGL